MARKEGACLICGKPLIYDVKTRKMECAICHGEFESYAACEDGHYVCDDCHAAKGIEVIMEGCRNTDSKNPIAIIQELMENPYIYMHGPEHHVMVGAALLAAYYNCGGFENRDDSNTCSGRTAFEEALEEMRTRGGEYPGGSCGLWGCCGAAVSTGMFMSIVTKATPLTGRSWGLSNDMTSRALGAIAALGGPRCCKRDSFTAVLEAAEFVKEHLKVEMELPDKVWCDFSQENQQCLKTHCPYYPKVNCAPVGLVPGTAIRESNRLTKRPVNDM